MSKKVVKLTEKDLTNIIKRVINENRSFKKSGELRKKLNDIFFGYDDENVSSDEGEYGDLSSEHRLSKKISPKQRVSRILEVISELENYISDLKDSIRSEETFVNKPDYEDIWKDVDNNL